MRTQMIWCFVVLAALTLACGSTSTATDKQKSEEPVAEAETPKETETAVAQSPAVNADCATKLSIFAEYAKVKNYDAAYEPWQMVRKNCPELNVATYAYGEKILEHKIKNTSGAEKSGHVQNLIALYDESITYFPGKYTDAGVTSDKAILMFDEKLKTGDELFSMLDGAFQNDRSNFKDPKALYLYFSTLVDMYNAGKKELQAVFDTYDDVTERIDEEKKKLLTVIDRLLPKEEAKTLSSKEKKSLSVNRSYAEAFDVISVSIDGKLGVLADCEKLIPLYTGNFPSKKSDAVWLKRAANRMDAKECSDDPLFIQIVEALHQLDPSAKSAYYLGFLNDKKGKSSEAIKYYNESLSLETDTYEKAKTALKIAYKYKNKGQKSTSRNYAKKALQYQPSLGRAYLLLASLYAGSANQCGDTAFKKRAIYWLAADIARKAGQADSSLKAEAKKAADSYSGRAPSTTDIFQKGMAGKTVEFKCWVGGSIKVPDLNNN